MKKFEVLEAHLGDQFYKPGDPETGFRNADPNEVQHLVDLGLLKLVGDAEEADGKPALDDGLNAQPVTNPEDAKTIADLRQQVETLAAERDAARTEVEALKKKAEKPSTRRAATRKCGTVWPSPRMRKSSTATARTRTCLA